MVKEWLYHFAFHQKNLRDLVSLHPYPVFGVVTIFYFNYCDRGILTAHCSIMSFDFYNGW
jgi:hypothetical protein